MIILRAYQSYAFQVKKTKINKRQIKPNQIKKKKKEEKKYFSNDFNAMASENFQEKLIFT